ncbi:MAG: hypothetical protein IJ911_14140 [Salinivirgaceae bacterium]|jgi:hypothetical protein|nr:hypothetical protein [Salinivirgaceae bacterium]
MNKITQASRAIVESLWFAAALMCVFIAVRECWRHNYSDALMFAGLAVLATLFFLLRRNQRKNADK